MGRRPIGDQAMTIAERLRRWRERKRQERGPVQVKPTSAEARQERGADKPTSEDIDRLRQENDRLSKRITVLEAATASAPRAQGGQAEPAMTLDMIATKTGREQAEAFIRQYRRKLDAEFVRRVMDGIRQRMDEIVLPHWRKKIEDAQNLYAKRRGLMDKVTFNTIKRALHPDSRNSISDGKLGEAFDTFMGLEKYLLNEANSPTPFPDCRITSRRGIG